MTYFQTSPTGSKRPAPQACTVLLLLLSSLTSCASSLTRALWSDDERLPVVTIQTLTSCPIQSIRGKLPTDAERGELIIEFSASPNDVGHLRSFTAEQPGQLILQAAPRNESALQHKMFKPEMIEIDVFNASYRQSNHFSAVLVYHGSSLSIDLGEWVPESEVRPLFRSATLTPITATIPALRDCLKTFPKHDWRRLLSTDPVALEDEGTNLIEDVLGYRNDAVIWIDPDGRYLSNEKMAAALAAQDREFSFEQCFLLGRLSGPPRQFVKIPTAVLLEIDDLDMQRENMFIRWRKCEVWMAQFAEERIDSIHVPPLPIPISRRAFTYLWAQDHELEPTLPGLATIGKVILTPITLVVDTLDFLVKSNSMLKGIRDALISEQKNQPIKIEGKPVIEERTRSYNLPQK